tara:strand:- start:277 stop:918 length:642 start_codon:yes stop_codon:yes gene_type:complete
VKLQDRNVYKFGGFSTDMLGSLEEWVNTAEEVIHDQYHIRELQKEAPKIYALAKEIVEKAEGQENVAEIVYDVLNERLRNGIPPDNDLIVFAEELVGYKDNINLFYLGIAEHLARGIQRDDNALYKAEKVVNAVLEVDDDNAAAHFLKGGLIYGLTGGDQEVALTHLEHAVALEPRNEEYREDRDVVLQRVEVDRAYHRENEGRVGFGGIHVF